MSTQFCHIRRDSSFGADVLLLGIWVQGVDDKLWIDHLHVGNKSHQGLSKFIKGFFALECDGQLNNRTRVWVIEGIQKHDYDLLWLNFRGHNHREPDYGVTEFVFLRLGALAVIPLISLNLFLIQDIAVNRNFDMSTQFCHIRRDTSIGADVLLLGIWVQGVDDKL